jgi:hypothetical protein
VRLAERCTLDVLNGPALSVSAAGAVAWRGTVTGAVASAGAEAAADGRGSAFAGQASASITRSSHTARLITATIGMMMQSRVVPSITVTCRSLRSGGRPGSRTRPGSTSGAVTALVPAARVSPGVASAGGMVARAVPGQAAAAPGNKYLALHNIASWVGSAVLAAQLFPIYGIPLSVRYDVEVAGATKSERQNLPNIPPASDNPGFIDVMFQYARAGLGVSYEIWETKTVGDNENQAVNLAYREAWWYSLILSARLAGQG